MDIQEQKREIRRKIRTLKGEQTQAERDSASSIIANKLLQLEAISSSRTILLYHSLPDEVLTTNLIRYLYSADGGSKRIIFPVVEGEYLTLKEYNSEELESGYRNIMEPSGGKEIAPSEIELAVIPGVAFDANCNRMGRGKGFYDKLLPYLKCHKVGLGYGFQIVEQIPCCPHDIPLDMVITESETYCRLL